MMNLLYLFHIVDETRRDNINKKSSQYFYHMCVLLLVKKVRKQQLSCQENGTTLFNFKDVAHFCPLNCPSRHIEGCFPQTEDDWLLSTFLPVFFLGLHICDDASFFPLIHRLNSTVLPKHVTDSPLFWDQNAEQSWHQSHECGAKRKLVNI